MRTSSSTRWLRFCASSMISRTLRPAACCSIRNWFSVASASGFLHLERRKSELHQHAVQETGGRQLGLVDLRNDDVLLQFVQERLDQRGLAGADLAADDDETVGEPDRRLHVGLGARMLLAQVQECRIRAQPERQFCKPEQVEIHAQLRPLHRNYVQSIIARACRSALSRSGARLLRIVQWPTLRPGAAPCRSREKQGPRSRAGARAIGHAAEEIDHRRGTQRARAAQGQAADRPQVVLELARHAPSIVQCPELCTRGAISLAISFPPPTKNSIASTPM